MGYEEEVARMIAAGFTEDVAQYAVQERAALTRLASPRRPHAVPVPAELPEPARTAEPCPRCGAMLWTDSRHLWCGQVDAAGRASCPYGVAEVVTLEQHREAP